MGHRSDNRPVLVPVGRWRARSRNLLPQVLVVTENPSLFFGTGPGQIVVGVGWANTHALLPVRDLEAYYEHIGEEG